MIKTKIYRSGLFLVACLSSCSLVCAATLSELIEGVLEVHPSVRAQNALSRASADAVDAARWQFYPTPSVALERVDAAAADSSYRNGDKSVATLRLQQPLWTGGRLTAGLSKAEAARLVSEAGLGITRQELAVRVVQAYADWHGGQFKSAALQTNVLVHQRLKVQIERRIAQGVSPLGDLILVEGRLAQTQAELISAQAQQSSALANLSQLLGRPVLAGELMPVLSRPLALGTVQSLLDQAQAGSPNVVKLIATARTQEAEVDERKADLQPEVYLRAERQFGNYSFRGAAPANRVFIGLTTRFGAGLSSQARVGAARALLDAALADIESTRVSLGQQIMADYLLVESSDKRLRLLNASLQSAVRISQAWERQFLAGTKSWLDVMNAAREQAQVEVQIAEVQAAQLLLTWRLRIVSQGVQSAIEPANVSTLAPTPGESAAK